MRTTVACGDAGEQLRRLGECFREREGGSDGASATYLDGRVAERFFECAQGRIEARAASISC
jgi:hypothetical protein